MYCIIKLRAMTILWKQTWKQLVRTHINPVLTCTSNERDEDLKPPGKVQDLCSYGVMLVHTYRVLWCNWIVTRGVALIKDLSPFVRVLVLAEIQNYKGQDVTVKVRFVQKSKLILGGGTGGGRGGGNNLFWNIWSYSAKMPEYENYEQVEGKNKLSPPPSYKAVISSTSRGSFENLSSFFYFTFYYCE